jgi:hypothetical protein
MMRRLMMFGEVIGTIGLTFAPIDFELALANSITDPTVAYVNDFGSFLFDSVIGDTGGGAVVGLDWGGGLGVS